MLIKTDENQMAIQGRDLVERTRHDTLETEKEHLRRERAPLTPDKAGMDLTNTEQRTGRAMSGWSLQQKLQKILPFLYFEKSNADPSKTGIYIQAPVMSPHLYRGRLMFLCGMESGIMPEFSIIEAEGHEVPDMNAPGGVRIEMGMAREIRGWRSVLANLLKKRMITAGEIERHFQITMGRDSQRWQELLAGRPELFSMEADNGGAVREDQRETNADGGAGGARDGEPGGGEGSHRLHDGAISGDDEGNSSPGRRDAGEEAGRGGAPSASNETDDRAGADRSRQPGEPAGALLS